MALVSSKQNITTTASQLGTGKGARGLLIIENPTGSGATIYIGASDVASDTGITLAPGAAPMTVTNGTRDTLAGEAWYARTASGTATGVKVLEA